MTKIHNLNKPVRHQPFRCKKALQLVRLVLPKHTEDLENRCGKENLLDS